MAELLWECLIISIVLLFGINIGLAMGLTRHSTKTNLIISISYGVFILIMSIISNFLITPFYNIINDYIPAIIGIIGIVTFLSGIYTIRSWKKNKQEYPSFLSVPTLSSSICYFAGFIFVFTLISNSIGSFFLEIGTIMALTVTLLMILSYSFSKILRNAESPYPVLLGNFMILNGFYFAVAALFLPNVKKLATVQMNPLSISSTSSMIFLIMAGLGVFLIGVYLKTEDITSLKDIYHRIRLSKAKKA